jgi:hypothetical protein
VRQKEKF